MCLLPKLILSLDPIGFLNEGRMVLMILTITHSAFSLSKPSIQRLLNEYQSSEVQLFSV